MSDVDTRIESAGPLECVECSECSGHHHWLEMYEGETHGAFFGCKHCELEADMCDICDLPLWPHDDSGVCPMCRSEVA